MAGSPSSSSIPPAFLRQNSASNATSWQLQPSPSMEHLLITTGHAARRTRRESQTSPAGTIKRRPSRLTLADQFEVSIDTRYPPGLGYSDEDGREERSAVAQGPELRWPSAGPHDPTPQWNSQMPSHTSNSEAGLTYDDWSYSPTSSVGQFTPRRDSQSSVSTISSQPRSPSTRTFTRAWKQVCGALRKPGRESAVPDGFEVVSPVVAHFS